MYDLSSAYHHVKIHPDHRKYLGFAIPGSDGKEEYYQFECMPFGLALATKCLASLTKPICALLAREGIRHSLYIDDGKINAPRALIGKHLDGTLEVLAKSGFVIAKEKTDTATSAAIKKEISRFHHRFRAHDSSSFGRENLGREVANL